MIHRLTKAGEVFAYAGLGYISYLFISGHLDLHFSMACALLSGLWLGLTAAQLKTLLRTYFDVLSRLKVRIPLTFGILLCLASILSAWPNWLTWLALIAALELGGWLWLYIRYRRNMTRFEEEGHGPLPKEAWVNPPPAALKEGDLILTSGRVATTLHETVGHVELVVEVGGEMMSFSSYMETGAVLNTLKTVCDQNETNGEHYIALRLLEPLDQVQKQLIPGLITIMLAQNARWKNEAILRRQAFFQRFHIPLSVQNLINSKFPITGYDWAGLFTGRQAEDHWECTGACLGLLHRVGVQTNDYGTGLLGLGTGLLDPIMPVRFLSDKHFHLLNGDDQKAFSQP